MSFCRKRKASKATRENRRHCLFWGTTRVRASTPWKKCRLKDCTVSRRGKQFLVSRHSRIFARIYSTDHRKCIIEDYIDEEDWLPKKKSKSKFSKLFEVSVTTLSFLAFGSYLLCLMASVMRQKSTDALAAVGTTVSPQIVRIGTIVPYPTEN